MKQFQSASEREAVKQRKRKRASIFLVVLLLLSSIGFALSSISPDQNASQTPTGNEPIYNGQYWVHTLGGKQYIFSQERATIDFSDVSMSRTLLDFSGKRVYIDTVGTLGLEALNINLNSYVAGGRVQEACYGPCDRDLPERNCTDDGELLIVRDSPTVSIREEDRCTFIDGGLAAVDAFHYTILGIQ
jgi:hypothetical protein